MTRFPRIFRTIFALIALIGTPLAADNIRTYDCSPTGFTTETDDQQFIQGNMEKRFLIQAGDQDIHVTASSRRFNSYRQEYRVFRKSGTESFGISEGSVGVGVIALSETYFEGAYHATISLQTSLFGNTWILSCQKF